MSSANTPPDAPAPAASASPPEALPPSTTHLPRLSRALRELLWSRRVAALGTLDDEGLPFVSMVPYAVAPAEGLLVVHVSALAAHSHNLRQRPAVSLLVRDEERAGEPVHALARVTLQARALEPAAGSELSRRCRQVYLARFPEAEPMTALPDFRFVAFELLGARQIAGFGAARSLDAEALRELLRGGTAFPTAERPLS